MTTLFPESCQFAIFNTEEGYHSVIGTYVHGEDTHHFHLITFQDLDGVGRFARMVKDYYEAHKTPIPHSFLVMNNQTEA